MMVPDRTKRASIPSPRGRYAVVLFVALWVPLPQSSQLAAASNSSVEAEITTIHPQSAPRLEWEEMLRHRSEYLRLKDKFEPARRIPRIDLDACERNEMLPPGLRPPQILMELRGCP